MPICEDHSAWREMCRMLNERDRKAEEDQRQSDGTTDAG
jgi:hypothetical protein